jgi:hypothetical protein
VVRIDSWPVMLRREHFRLWAIDPAAIVVGHVAAGTAPLADVLPPNELFLPPQRWNVLAAGRAAPLAASSLIIGAGVVLDCQRLFEPLLVLAEEHPGTLFPHFNLSLTPEQSLALIADPGTVLDAIVWCDFDDRETAGRWRSFDGHLRSHRPRVAAIPMEAVDPRTALDALYALRSGKYLDTASGLYRHTVAAIEHARARRVP